MKRSYLTVLLVVVLMLIAAGTAGASNPNPGVIPNEGTRYGDLGAKWWQWAFTFPAADLPFLNTGGAVDASAGQSGPVWYLAGANKGLSQPRTATVPSGRSLFFPIFNLINDYPCPAEYGMEPPPGETLEHFLQRTGNEFLDSYYVPDPAQALFAEIDGTPVQDLVAYRATSSIFKFKADPSLASWFDPCITGTLQDGVAVGWWLSLPPLTPGEHTLHFGATGVPVTQDVTYVLTVTPGQ